MLEPTDRRKSLKLKKIFCPQTDTRQSTAQPKKKKKGVAALNISAPMLQNSESAIGLAISPSLITETDKRRRQQETTQPMSAPAPGSQRNKSNNSVSPSPYGNNRSTNLRKKTLIDKNTLLLQKVSKISNNKEHNPSHARRTVATDLSGRYRSRKEQSYYYYPDPTFTTSAAEEASRRHSCSSVGIFSSSPGQQQPQQQQQQQQHSSYHRQPMTPTTPTSKSKLLKRHSEKQQQQQSQQQLQGNQSASPKSFSKLKQWNNKVGAVSSTAAVSLELKPSRSTPLRKVKTYNLHKKLLPEEKEKQRKMQELEDLISGRRGSTLKLSLTPKALLY